MQKKATKRELQNQINQLRQQVIDMSYLVVGNNAVLEAICNKLELKAEDIDKIVAEATGIQAQQVAQPEGQPDKETDAVVQPS